MANQLKKKYGLPMAIAMVVGIVIGSGIFFKAEKVLAATGGNLWLSISAWLIGGAIMLSCIYVFSILATRHEKLNGVVDYAEAIVGKKYGYFIGWFIATIYGPMITAVLCWVSARYTAVLLGFENPISGAETFIIAAVYMVLIYAMNVLSPKIAGKFQVSSAVIKLIPLILMGVVGTILGLLKGTTVANFGATVVGDVTSNPLMTAVVATAFAYEGWILATSINSEIKNSRRNLPIALLAGAAIIIVIYVIYFIGISSMMPTSEIIAGGEAAIKGAFSSVFTNIGGTALFVFIVISCLGTTNGLMVAATRGLYSLAARDLGPKTKLLSQVDKHTNMPTNAAIVSLVVIVGWLLVWFGNFAGWYGDVFFDISELPVVTIYALYIPIFIGMIITHKQLNKFNRYVAPSLAIIGSVFMIIAAIYSHQMTVVWYLVVFAIIQVVGLWFYSDAKRVKKGGKASRA